MKADILNSASMEKINNNNNNKIYKFVINITKTCKNAKKLTISFFYDALKDINLGATFRILRNIVILCLER